MGSDSGSEGGDDAIQTFEVKQWLTADTPGRSIEEESTAQYMRTVSQRTGKLRFLQHSADGRNQRLFIIGRHKQAGALKELEAKGVMFHTWSDDFLAEMKKAWDRVVAKKTAEDPLFKEVYDHYTTFRAEYAVWKDRGYLK